MALKGTLLLAADRTPHTERDQLTPAISCFLNGSQLMKVTDDWPFISTRHLVFWIEFRIQFVNLIFVSRSPVHLLMYMLAVPFHHHQSPVSPSITLSLQAQNIPFLQIFPSAGKGKGLDTCYSAAYMSHTRDQQRFTISEVAADWHDQMVSQRIMWPSIARANGQLDPRCS